MNDASFLAGRTGVSVTVLPRCRGGHSHWPLSWRPAHAWSYSLCIMSCYIHAWKSSLKGTKTPTGASSSSAPAGQCAVPTFTSAQSIGPFQLRSAQSLVWRRSLATNMADGHKPLKVPHIIGPEAQFPPTISFCCALFLEKSAERTRRGD